jgi:spore coat protein U-like protein
MPMIPHRTPRTGAPFVGGRQLARWLPVLLLALACLFCPGKAAAQSCWVSSQPTIAFGQVDPAGKSTSDDLTVTCQGSGIYTAFRICMFIPEGAPIPGIDPRWMTNYNGAQMAYDLYSDAAHTQIIGPYGSGYPIYSTTAGSFLGFQTTATMRVYANAPANQHLPATYGFQSQIANGQIRYSYNNNNTTAPSVAQCVSGTGADGSGTATFYTGVSATFANTCYLNTATDLDFGNVTNLATARDQISTITLHCPTGTAWKIGLDNGSHASGSTRRMTDGSGHYVSYELYRDAGRTQRWGNTPNTDTSNGTGNNAIQTATVYGRVPAQATPAGGSYADTVTVTLTF